MNSIGLVLFLAVLNGDKKVECCKSQHLRKPLLREISEEKDRLNTREVDNGIVSQPGMELAGMLLVDGRG